jgi:hypothetical protein
MPVFPNPDPVDSLCTITLPGDPDPIVVNLGIDDAWIETRVERGRNIYVVHAQFVSRDGTPFYIEGTARAAAEEYIKTLKTALYMTEMFSDTGPDGSVIYCPGVGAVPGTLENPYTGFEEDDCYCTSITTDDSGGRAYGLDITFEQPTFENGGEAGTADFTFGSVEIGNQPGYVVSRVDNNFTYYEAHTRYNADTDGTYLSELADDLNLSEIFLHPLPRGAEGNRGIIKSYTTSSDTLTWESKSATYSDCWLQNLVGERGEGGVLNIVATFVKVR